tara:strand:- start:251 stop:478 length:228 start_codon:yes stop_codon:yes gene_type:complete
MAAPLYSTLPASVQKKPTPFEVSVPDDDIAELKQLLKLSRLPKKTYENQQEDRRYGVNLSWLTEVKRAWLEEFDW